MNSPAFRKTYAAWRAENRPVAAKHEGTVDQEVKAKLAQMRAEADSSYKQLAAAGRQAQADAYRKQFEATLAAMEPNLRREVEEARVNDAARLEQGTKYWQEYYPEDPLVSVAKHLREYLAATADVDFAAKQERRMNGIGKMQWFFVNPAYEKKPWQWRTSFYYGPEVTAAGRAAAAAWLKEIGR